jgi:hypothetical protein
MSCCHDKSRVGADFSTREPGLRLTDTETGETQGMRLGLTLVVLLSPYVFAECDVMPPPVRTMIQSQASVTRVDVISGAQRTSISRDGDSTGVSRSAIGQTKEYSTWDIDDLPDIDVLIHLEDQSIVETVNLNDTHLDRPLARGEGVIAANAPESRLRESDAARLLGESLVIERFADAEKMTSALIAYGEVGRQRSYLTVVRFVLDDNRRLWAVTRTNTLAGRSQSQIVRMSTDREIRGCSSYRVLPQFDFSNHATDESSVVEVIDLNTRPISSRCVVKAADSDKKK